MSKHDHDMIAEDRPSEIRHDDEIVVFEKEYKNYKLTIVACGNSNEDGEDFSFEHFRYITESQCWSEKANAYHWGLAHEQDDLAASLIDIFQCDCHIKLAGMMSEIFNFISQERGGAA